MPRLLLHVEGQTEETFVNEVLVDHLVRSGYETVGARLVGNPRMKRGGIRPWQGVKRDILRHLKEDRSAIAAIMVDYYGLPHHWPGRAEAPGEASTSGKAEFVESALLEDIAEQMGDGFDRRRFTPLVMMHEFEALLFSDPDRFAHAIGNANLTQGLREIRQKFACPEDIDDSPLTAPSKRIESLFPGYEKPLSGVIAALEIGLQTMRRECPHFNDWLNRLEALPEAFPRTLDPSQT
jgi:Domain of unknown function (DUF4276)